MTTSLRERDWTSLDLMRVLGFQSGRLWRYAELAGVDAPKGVGAGNGQAVWPLEIALTLVLCRASREDLGPGNVQRPLSESCALVKPAVVAWCAGRGPDWLLIVEGSSFLVDDHRFDEAVLACSRAGSLVTTLHLAPIRAELESWSLL